MAGHRAQQDRAIAHCAGERPGLVERRGVRDDAPAGASPISRLYAHGAGEGGGLTDRAAGIGAGGAEAEMRGHRRRRAAGRAAGHQLGIGVGAPPWRHRRPETRRLVRRAHGELVIVGLAQHHGAVAPELRGDGRLVGRHEIVEDVRAGRGAHVLGAEQILDGEWDPFQRPAVAAGQPRVGLLRHGARLRQASPARRR